MATSEHDLTRAVRDGFAWTFGHEAQVVGRAPGRVNLIGEHTDYNAGLVLPVALRHATYAAVAVRDDDEVHLDSAQSSAPWKGTPADLGRAEGWAAYVAGVLWALREDGVEMPGFEVYVDTTVPVGAGLSSSAALECSVAVAVSDLLGLPLDRPGRDRLIRACMRAETDVAGAPTGGMDQTVSLLASADAALLIDFDTHTSRDVPLHLDEAGLALLVTDTRVSHALTDGGYAARRADCEEAARLLGLPTLRAADLRGVESLTDDRLRRRARHVVTEIARVTETVDAVDARDWAGVGELFARSHASMRDDFEISCPELDTAVEAATGAGAVGARMTGGGFGGSAIAVVAADRVDHVRAAVDEAFAARGFGAPAHLLAVPSAAADVVTE